jgi:serine protease
MAALVLSGSALAQTVPKLSVSPSSLSFSSTPVGIATAARAITLKNSGGGTLQVSGVTVSGANAADFIASNTCNVALSAGRACSVSVSFRPTAVGSRVATLQIQTNAGSTAVSLKGSAAAPPQPAITVSPMSLTFPSTTTGTKSSGLTLKLTNTGKAALQVSSVMISNSQEFASVQTCTNSSIAPAGTCEITVFFAPSAVGSRTGSLVIKSNIADRTVSLKGTGAVPAQPAITISPTSLTFPSTSLGTKSSGLTLRLTNTGKAALQVSSVMISNSQEFAGVQSCTNSPIAPGGTCEITVFFAPTAAGSRAGSLVIKSNIPDRTVSLKGTGAASAQPAITISPTSLSFPSTPIGTKSAGLTLKLTNTGKAPLQVASVMVSNPQEFSAVQTCSTSSIAPAGTCDITVFFTPSAAGSRTGSLVVKSNIADRTVSFSGTGAVPETITIAGVLSVNSGLLIDADTNDPRQVVTADNNTCAASQFANAPAVIGGYVTQISTGKNGDRFAITTDKFDVYRTTLSAGSTIELTTGSFNPSAASADILYLGLLSSDCKTYLQSAAEDLGTKTIVVAQTGSYYLVVYAIKGGSSYVVRLLPPATGIQSTKSTIEFTAPSFIDNQVVVSKSESVDLETTLSNLSRRQGGVFSRSSRTVSGLVNSKDSQGQFRSEVQEYFQEMSIPLGEINDYGATALVKIDRRTAAAALREEARARAQATVTGGSPTARRIEDSRSVAEVLGAKFASEELKNYLEMSEVAQDLARKVGAKRGELNIIQSTQSTGDPEAYKQRWHYDAIKLSQALALQLAAPKSDVVVAVIDSGVYSAHPDLSTQSVPGYDFIEDLANAIDGDGRDANPDDPGQALDFGDVDYHGTHVAGTVAAAADNGIGGYGVAGAGGKTKVMNLRVCGQRDCAISDTVNAIRFAAGQTVAGVRAARKADIINMSLGGANPCLQAYQDAINVARAAGVIVVAAAGNDYEEGNPSSSPANCSGVVAVGAIGPDGKRAHYSQVQEYVDVAAPGGDWLRIEFQQPQVFSSWAAGKLRSSIDTRSPAHNSISGTSMASPHVAGVAALMRSVWPAMTPADFDSALVAGKLTTLVSGVTAKTKEYGYGLVDAAKSVAYALEKKQSGGTVQSYVTADPAALDFGSTGTTLALNIRKFGNAAVRDVSPLVSVKWLRVVRSSSSATSDTYVLSVDRAGVVPGAYSVILRVTDTLGLTQDVAVTMRVAGSTATSSSGAPVYVLVWDALSQKTVAFVQVDSSTLDARSFNLTPLKSTSNYLLIAGSDSDNDRFICEVGDLCSAWPIDEKLSGVSSSVSTPSAKLTVGFENRSVAAVTASKVGGLWLGKLDNSNVLVFAAETGNLQGFEVTDESLDSTIWGLAVSTGNQIRVDYTAADDGKVLGTGVLAGEIAERVKITGEVVFTNTNGNTSVPSKGEFLFDDLYNKPSSLPLVAGKWAGSSGESYEIDSAGKMTFSDAQSGCKGNGQIRLINPAFNMYDLRFTISGCSSQFGFFTGATINGLAVLDFDASSLNPPMYFLGQNRVGTNVYPVILLAKPIK